MAKHRTHSIEFAARRFTGSPNGSADDVALSEVCRATARIIEDRFGARIGQQPLPSEGAMAVRISISSVRQTGTTVTPKGEASSLWRVSFQLAGDYFLATMVTIEVAGPQDALGAQQEALSIFRRFAQEIGGAAEHFQPFSN